MKQISAVRDRNRPSGQAPVNVSQSQPVEASALRSTPTIDLVPRRLLEGLLVIVGVLVLAGLAANHLQFGVDVRYEHADSFIQLFDLNTERNVPTWFASLLLFTNALLLTLIAGATFQARDRWRWFWCGLALIFVYLSMDEAAIFHERVARPLREAFDLTGFLHHAWVLPAMACLLVFGVLYLRFALALPWRTFKLFAFAAVLYVGGALGVEMIGGNHSSKYGEENLSYGLIAAVEETLEKLGQVVFLFALVDYIGTRWKSASLRFKV